MKTGFITAAIAVLALMPTAQATDVGVAASVVSSATGDAGGEQRPLSSGAELFHDETIRTAADARVQVLLVDETALTIGANAEVTLDDFVYDPDTNVGTFALNASRGAFRFVSGSLQSASYRIETPVAVIGVRGTILDVHVAEDGTASVTLVEGGAVVSALGGAGGLGGEVGGGQTVTLSAPGQMTVVAPGAAPTPATGETRQAAQLFAQIRQEPFSDFARVVAPEAPPVDLQNIRDGRSGRSAPPAAVVDAMVEPDPVECILNEEEVLVCE